MTDAARSIVLLAQENEALHAIYHALHAHFGDVGVVIEDRQSRLSLFLGRARRLGLVTAAGQALFVVLIEPWLSWRSRARRREIVAAAGLDPSPIHAEVVHVSSVNSEEARNALRAMSPKVVVVSGTRIIGQQTLRCVEATFLNVHAGITPLYRGVHGAYWALVDGRSDLAGATIHLVDEGIDTGGVIIQTRIAITSDDSFATYPVLQLASALPSLVEAVRASLDGRLTVRTDPPGLPSRLRYHPTLWGYLAARVARGVK